MLLLFDFGGGIGTNRSLSDRECSIERLWCADIIYSAVCLLSSRHLSIVCSAASKRTQTNKPALSASGENATGSVLSTTCMVWLPLKTRASTSRLLDQTRPLTLTVEWGETDRETTRETGTQRHKQTTKPRNLLVTDIKHVRIISSSYKITSGSLLPTSGFIYRRSVFRRASQLTPAKLRLPFIKETRSWFGVPSEAFDQQSQ